MHTYCFQLTKGDQNVGTVYLPDVSSLSLPVIIYCHGWGANRQLGTTTQVLCDRAIQENMAFVTFDFFGCGETGGNYAEMTYLRWKNNLSDVISWVQTQPFADRNRIGCFSISSGTTAALRLALEDAGIAFVVSVGTCISAHIGMGQGGPAKILIDHFDHLLHGGTASLFGTEFPLSFFIDTIGNAPIHTMANIKCPVLFLQGTADNTFRCADAKMGYDRMRNANLPATHIELEGGTHGLDNMADKAAVHVFDWLSPILDQ